MHKQHEQELISQRKELESSKAKALRELEDENLIIIEGLKQDSEDKIRDMRTEFIE